MAGPVGALTSGTRTDAGVWAAEGSRARELWNQRRNAAVASDLGGPREIVCHGETGFLVPPNDPISLAGALLRLIKDPGLRDRMGRAGAARLKEHFLAGRMARELEEVYGALAKPHGSQRRMLW